MPDRDPRTEALDLLLDGLAAARLTRLITADTVTAPFRRSLMDRGRARLLTEDRSRFSPAGQSMAAVWGDEVTWSGGPLAYAVSCPWCSGIYVGLGVALASRLGGLPWRQIARGLALAAVAGELASRDR